MGAHGDRPFHRSKAGVARVARGPPRRSPHPHSACHLRSHRPSANAEEVDAFEHDRSPDAFAKVIDRLLASPRYGERWGRLWLDVARYSDDRLDSERDNPYPASFRYRDWVIQAIQNDMPYDLFVKAQMAGDQLPDHEKYEAGLGFYALSPEMQDDRVDATARGFLGLTVACAQCHDHKYDPIPTLDFYSLMGIFRNTDLHEVPLAPKETVDAYKAQKARIEKKEKELRSTSMINPRSWVSFSLLRPRDYLLTSAEAQARCPTRPLSHARSGNARPAGRSIWPIPRKQHPFLKVGTPPQPRPQRRAQKAATDFQAQVLAVIAEKKHVDDENHRPPGPQSKPRRSFQCEPRFTGPSQVRPLGRHAWRSRRPTLWRLQKERGRKSTGSCRVSGWIISPGSARNWPH